MKSIQKIKSIGLVSAILAAFWFTACKTTPQPSSPTIPQPQTQETDQKAPAPPASENRKPDSAGAQQESQARQKSSHESKQPPEQTSTETAVSQPAASKQTDPSRSAQSTQKADAGQPKAPTTAKGKLDMAREDLRVSEATEQKIADKLEQLKKSGSASDEDIRNYEIYHERVEAMVAEHRKRVEEMERAYRQHTPQGKPSSQTQAGKGPSASDETMPEGQYSQDQVAELDRQLSASLSQFDTMLLKEMETIETQSEAKMRDLAQEAAEAAKRLKAKGIDLGSKESESSDGTSEESAENQEASGEQDGSETEQGDVDGAVAASDQPLGEGSGPKGGRGSRYSKEDDDIVARQLREAAENETDPELKEKLWKEYEDYKKNTQ